MNATYHADKDHKNREAHGLSLAEADGIDWNTAVTFPDLRRDYGEKRFATYAMYNGRLHCLVWTPRDGGSRPISFRKANKREQRKYEEEKNRTTH